MDIENTERLLSDIRSKDSHRIWIATSIIGKLSQNEAVIHELLRHEREILDSVSNVDLGGLLLSNQRFIDKMIEIFEHYKHSSECSCKLLGLDSDPLYNVKKGYLSLNDTVYVLDSNYIDYYIVTCLRCNRKYHVKEVPYHFTVYSWQEIEID